MSVYTKELANRFILVVEDESIVAIDMASIISMAGGRVIGPFQSIGQGLRFREFRHIDAALLDISLNGEPVFKLADAIAKQDIPIVFLSGRGIDIVPPEHRQSQFLSKPCETRSIISALKAAWRDNANAEKKSA
jgi:FixJ family two-component response regulator